MFPFHFIYLQKQNYSMLSMEFILAFIERQICKIQQYFLMVLNDIKHHYTDAEIY